MEGTDQVRGSPPFASLSRAMESSHDRVVICVDSEHRERKKFSTVWCPPREIDTGDSHGHIAGLSNPPAHCLARFPVGFVHRLGRNDASTAAAP